MIIGATESTDEIVRTEAYASLVAIADLYYDKLPDFVESIYQRTLAALQNDQEADAVRLQAIEFWATTADAESEIQLQADEAAEAGTQENYVCFNIVATVFPHFATHLLRLLPVDESTGKDDLADNEDWTLAMAAATCLKSIALCIGDDVVDHVMPFINTNIGGADWRMREAAVMAFGSIMEGTEEKVVVTLELAMQVLLRLMCTDESLMVRDTAAWSMGVACSTHTPQIVTPALLPSIMQAIIQVLQKKEEAPSGFFFFPFLVSVFFFSHSLTLSQFLVAASACWAIDSIADSIFRGETHSDVTLDPYFNDLVSVLLEATQRVVPHSMQVFVFVFVVSYLCYVR